MVTKPSARELDKPEYLPPPEEQEFELPPVVEPPVQPEVLPHSNA